MFLFNSFFHLPHPPIIQRYASGGTDGPEFPRNIRKVSAITVERRTVMLLRVKVTPVEISPPSRARTHSGAVY
jgi:hypothetical protein